MIKKAVLSGLLRVVLIVPIATQAVPITSSSYGLDSVGTVVATDGDDTHWAEFDATGSQLDYEEDGLTFNPRSVDSTVPNFTNAFCDVATITDRYCYGEGIEDGVSVTTTGGEIMAAFEMVLGWSPNSWGRIGYTTYNGDTQTASSYGPAQLLPGYTWGTTDGPAAASAIEQPCGFNRIDV